jgi:hypothetical protein
MTRKDRENRRLTAAMNRESRDREIRAIVRKFSHRPILDIVQILRERTGIAADIEFVRKVWNESQDHASLS